MITLHGREVGFVRNVWANIQIGKIAPNGDIVEFGKNLTDGSFIDQMETTIKLLLILNEAYERQKKFEDPDYHGSPITEEEIMVLSDDEFSALATEAMTKFSEDSKQTIKTEPKNAKRAAERK